MNPQRHPDKLPRPLPISKLRAHGVPPGATDGVKNKQPGAEIILFVGGRREASNGHG